MPRVKVSDDELDVQALEEAEYSDEDFVSYDGELPAAGTILIARLSKMWWTDSSNGDRMFKVLVLADENQGDLAEYDGLPMWENIVLTPGAKFKWQPMMDQFGFTVRDVKSKLYLADEDHPQFGAPVEKIGTFVPDSDAAWCRVVTKNELFEGTWRAHVSKWLDYEASEEPEDEAEEEPEESEEDEREEEAPPPARGARRAPAQAAKPATARTPAKASRAAPAATAAPPARRGARTAPAPAKAAPAKRGARRGAAQDVEDNEPPF